MTGTEIEALIVAGQTKETCINIQRWYQKAKVQPPSPTREKLNYTSNLKDDLSKNLPRRKRQS